jgi:hypothetical protein
MFDGARSTLPELGVPDGYAFRMALVVAFFELMYVESLVYYLKWEYSSHRVV